LHDDLAEIATPFYLHELVEHARGHGLAFLAEAELSESQMRGVPESAAQLIRSLPDDVVVREQYLDFFKNRMFRRTLLCHAELDVQRELDERRLSDLHVAAQLALCEDTAEEPVATGEQETFATPEGFTVTTSEPLVRAALGALAEAWPAALSFAELLSIAEQAAGPQFGADVVAERLRTVLLQAYLGRIVQLLGCDPPLSARPGERPLASPLARAQCAAGSPAVSSLLHANVRLEGALEPRLLCLLDGARDTDALVRETGAGVEEVRAALTRFAAVGLLACV
ncbi:MAG TPA: methyltransferase regulatory domain-containing protein, partial [Solirubrobacteraceae bacterium]|nr:methyltransferase regulatory domain-containing protein [Solirubrobacteraceae bacterium]